VGAPSSILWQHSNTKMNIEFLNRMGTKVEKRKLTSLGYKTDICENVTRKPMYSYLKQKCHFFFYKNGKQEGRIGPV
jgi:hypothetical protein